MRVVVHVAICEPPRLHNRQLLSLSPLQVLVVLSRLLVRQASSLIGVHTPASVAEWATSLANSEPCCAQLVNLSHVADFF